MVEDNLDPELENDNTKNHMVQVRMNNKEFRKFWLVRRKLKADNNSSTLRMLIKLAADNNGESIEDELQKQALMEDISASTQALLRQITGIANNVNQIAYGVNKLNSNDPDNQPSWDWIVKNVQQVNQQVPELHQLIETIKQKVGA
ncbi:plasmid mobilization relaxosome protein MobC [Limosilactobacillus coleohominis]|uniref:Bacterial mobilisation domain-containing protein n=1 Tax=Limosilactobacillus coleohominis TaxID=181675 RepID=A0ABS2GWN8_9LACO|nr:plasmid mobilization relaxosome protein MobC [Limosilactobacillus coleohominis]MBM6940053.1 hypothetical protein [Limosilactobacillus coleohominis]